MKYTSWLLRSRKTKWRRKTSRPTNFHLFCFVHYFIDAENNATKRREIKNISARQHLTSSRVDCASVHLCQFAEYTRRTMTMIDEWWLKNSHTINLLFVAGDLSAQFSSRIDSKLAQEFRTNLLQIYLHARWHSDCLPHGHWHRILGHRIAAILARAREIGRRNNRTTATAFRARWLRR